MAAVREEPLTGEELTPGACTTEIKALEESRAALEQAKLAIDSAKHN